jgi:DNA-directed RNA polymerase specialized sigma24 family protein
MRNQYPKLKILETVSIYCEGDNDSFAFLFNFWKSELYSYVLRYLKNEKEAEDVLYDTFEKIIRIPIDYRKEKFIIFKVDFKAFLKNVIKNGALDILKTKKIGFESLTKYNIFF